MLEREGFLDAKGEAEVASEAREDDDAKVDLGPPPNVGALAAAACMVFRSSSETSRPPFLLDEPEVEEEAKVGLGPTPNVGAGCDEHSEERGEERSDKQSVVSYSGGRYAAVTSIQTSFAPRPISPWAHHRMWEHWLPQLASPFALRRREGGRPSFGASAGLGKQPTQSSASFPPQASS